ncbi:MAG: sigma-54 dependent transcriptional regulator [Proteobacteria bacterium]|nr:sigma-54 dependent transcriptional regulator [Pseudomonadota bacterium]MBU4295042.1 sigma-54 dependent transcriptional regulator [Pseudomonadota bacterium]MCG2746606.1 sigma-54 dependent transcriptional regulator [Desulfobulbaceae bacterium]
MSVILIIDDDKLLCRSLQIQLEAVGHKTCLAHTMHEGLETTVSARPDLILLDINLPDQSGLLGLPALLEKNHGLCVVIMTGNPDNKAVIDSMRKGAFDYLRKPLDLDELFAMVEKMEDRKKMTQSLQSEQLVTPRPSLDDLIGAHPKIIELLKQIGLLSRSRVTVLIQGESGTGKELVAKILHASSSPGMPFVAINCSAVVPTLLESELFGYEKGAFTGADKIKIGKMEFAGEGTVFLDEIGDMPHDLQSKLLRVLQEEEFVRVGGLETIPLKARIVTATHRDLQGMVEQGQFRQDLFYRLNVSTLNITPLRFRREDIPLLVDSLLARISAKLHCDLPSVSEAAMKKMINYNWPGNVRELENVLTRAAALSRDNRVLAEDIVWQETKTPAAADQQAESFTLAEAEKSHITSALLENDWNITHTALKLAISPTTLRKKINDFDIRKPTT